MFHINLKDLSTFLVLLHVIMQNARYKVCQKMDKFTGSIMSFFFKFRIKAKRLLWKGGAISCYFSYVVGFPYLFNKPVALILSVFMMHFVTI